MDKQEPVARVDYNERGSVAWFLGPHIPNGTLLYSTPPKREWVGLTGLEQKELMAMNSRYAVFETEAKLKEKNVPKP